MAGTWQPIANQPQFNASTMLLLTDGTVMCQAENSSQWWKLVPDAYGRYLSGTWRRLADARTARLYYASAVLADGRVLVSGGEYTGSNVQTFTNATEIYAPVVDTWTSINPPAGWNQIGDAACCLLPDGRLLLGDTNGTRTAVFDHSSNTWAAGPNKTGRSDEESWVLLPDETVLTVETFNSPNSEKYVAASNTWVTAGAPPDQLVQVSSNEIGAGVLLTDGRALFLGATGHTALYTAPPIASQAGSWVAGPDFPVDPDDPAHGLLAAKDAPACLLPSGKVLCTAGSVVTGQGYGTTASFFEFDGNALTRVPDPANNGTPPYRGRMMLLPTGEVLYVAGSQAAYLYTPNGGPQEDWKPTITDYPHSIQPFHTYALRGRQLNGLSQAVCYGDDAASATNYPIVKITDGVSGRVWYCRTFDHSSMGVATGTVIQSTNFKAPAGVPTGPATLSVIANGIESDPVAVNVAAFSLRMPFDDAVFDRLVGSFADGTLLVLGPGGPIPVGPGDGERYRQAAEIYSRIGQEVGELRSIGQQMAAEQRAPMEAGREAPASSHRKG